MKFSTNKAKLTAVIFVLVLTFSAILAALPTVGAHDPPWKITTYAYVIASPNPVGVGQTSVVLMWVIGIPAGVPATAAGVGGYRWANMTIEITNPDGTTETRGPLTSDPTGSTWTVITPDQVGTYKIDFYFPEQVLSLYHPITGVEGDPSRYSDYINDIYLPSNASTTLTVQEDPVPGPPTYPLPNEYWTRPIEGQNTAWYTIASHYLNPFGRAYQYGSQRFQPSGTAPDSPHIMWTKPLADGGVVGGSYSIPEVTYYTGLSYESRFNTPLIIYGRLYYDTPLSDDADDGPYVCVDLRTGETLWENEEISPRFGQLYLYESMNQHGVIGDGYLWQESGDRWDAYDSRTGEWLFALTNVPRGTNVYGSNEEITRYVIDYEGRWLALWTTEPLPDSPLVREPGTGTNAYQYRPIGKEADMSTNYLWNVTISDLPEDSTILAAIPDDILLGSTPTNPEGSRLGTRDRVTVWAISLDPSTRGQLLWSKDYPEPAGNLTRLMGPVDPETRVFTMNDKETMQWLGYSLDNGDLLWGPLGEPRALNYYPTVGMGSSGQAGFVAYGNLYVGGYGGEFFCYDLVTGNLEWKYNNTFSGTQTPWGNYPIFPAAIADGKVYLYTSEHSPNVPPYKGVKVRCVDAFTGEELWTMLGWGTVGGFSDEGWPVADGYLVYLNAYDMQVYCIGKGPSATTVTASPKIIAKGNSVMIEGTVTDQSAGTKQQEQAARFPNGVPAISDEHMGEWMEYLYMQKPCPTYYEGVDVKLEVFDPNGNFYEIGTVKSDGSGMFKKMWTPDVEGEYTIIATFEGSESYWSSYAETALGVGPAAAPSGPIEPEPTEPEEAPFITTEIAIIIAVVVIAIIGIVAYWALKKRK
jgi:outer membrane protein assembly factor BamB